MITIIGSGAPMPTRSVSEPWAKAVEINIEHTPRISLLGPLPAKERWYRAEICADYSGRRPNCNAARQRGRLSLRGRRGPAKGAAQPATIHGQTRQKVPAEGQNQAASDAGSRSLAEAGPAHRRRARTPRARRAPHPRLLGGW